MTSRIVIDESPAKSSRHGKIPSERGLEALMEAVETEVVARVVRVVMVAEQGATVQAAAGEDGAGAGGIGPPG